MTDVVRQRRRLFLAAFAVVVVAVAASFRAVLMPFLLGSILAYVLHPLVGALSRVRVGKGTIPRWVAVLMIYFTLVSTLAFTLVAVIPRVTTEAREFVVFELPAMRTRAERTWGPRVAALVSRAQGLVAPRTPHAAVPVVVDPDAPDDPTLRIEPVPGGGYRVALPPEGIEVERIDDNHFRARPALRTAPSTSPLAVLQEPVRRLGAGHVDDIVRVGSGIIGGVIGGIFNFFMTLMVSAYLLVTEAQIFGFLRSLVRPESRDAFDELLHRLDRGLSGVVRGQLIICVVNGSLSAVGFALAGLKYWPTLALVATVFSLVPIFGTVMSSVPAVAVGLTQSFGTGIFVLLWILGIHQLEANLLNPKIMGDAAKIHPVLVVFSLLAGEHFAGIVGALLSVPVMSIAQSLFLHWRKYALAYSDGSSDG